MINACGLTLQDLDSVTKRYREIDIEPNLDPANVRAKGKKLALEDVKRGFKVNWTKIRWDREKQSLQQYREKLKSHTDAVSLVLITTIW